MLVRRPLNATSWIILAVGLFGCASTSAPSGWLSTPQENQSQSYGGWIEIDWSDASGIWKSEGELLTLGADAVYLLVDDVVMAIAPKQISYAKLTFYSTDIGPIKGWTLLGTLSTISHGFGLALTAPIWILVGSFAAAEVSHRPQLIFPKTPLQEFQKYARFPQGFPPGFEGQALKPKR